jgi:hypothetical protein
MGGWLSLLLQKLNESGAPSTGTQDESCSGAAEDSRAVDGFRALWLARTNHGIDFPWALIAEDQEFFQPTSEEARAKKTSIALAPRFLFEESLTK